MSAVAYDPELIPPDEWLRRLAERLPEVHRFLYVEEHAELESWICEIQNNARRKIEAA